jgi:hypothetical protein
METSIIEKLDKSRYNLIKWLTVGWAAWFGTYILKDLINHELIVVQWTTVLVGVIGFILFIINLQKYLRLASKIKNSRLNEALNNELIRLNAYKSFFMGFWTVIVIICIFFVLSLFYKISALIVCEITLYFGVLSPLIAGLIYNRD